MKMPIPVAEYRNTIDTLDRGYYRSLLSANQIICGSGFSRDSSSQSRRQIAQQCGQKPQGKVIASDKPGAQRQWNRLAIAAEAAPTAAPTAPRGFREGNGKTRAQQPGACGGFVSRPTVGCAGGYRPAVFAGPFEWQHKWQIQQRRCLPGSGACGPVCTSKRRRPFGPASRNCETPVLRRQCDLDAREC